MEIKTNVIDAHLFALLGSHYLVEDWWKSKNKAFEMKTPLEVWEEEGGPKRIQDYVFSIAYDYS